MLMSAIAIEEQDIIKEKKWRKGGIYFRLNGQKRPRNWKLS